VGAPAIVLVHNREIPEEMQAAASREGVALLRTTDDQFHAALRVGKALGIGVGE
jgi:serine kinase of HPr protein (carbohydrate metabolism regulator)